MHFPLSSLGIFFDAESADVLQDGTGDLVATTYTAQQGFFIQDVGDNDTYTVRPPLRHVRLP